MQGTALNPNELKPILNTCHWAALASGSDFTCHMGPPQDAQSWRPCPLRPPHPCSAPLCRFPTYQAQAFTAPIVLLPILWHPCLSAPQSVLLPSLPKLRAQLITSTERHATWMDVLPLSSISDPPTFFLGSFFSPFLHCPTLRMASRTELF
jgi:hypothetical protein